MPRHARLELPDTPLHIIQRGVNRCATFLDDDDRFHFLRLLGERAVARDVAIHAYVLMGNHVHLLVTASRAGSVARMMHAVGLCYVQSFNRRHGRTGTLWEGRFKSCLVDSDRYLLTVYRYIELNPVRAAMVESPEHYRWSNARANLNVWHDPLVTPHRLFLGIASTVAERAIVYRRLLDEGTNADDLCAIRMHLQQQRALGDRRFQAMIEKTLERPASCRPCGRPMRCNAGFDAGSKKK